MEMNKKPSQMDDTALAEHINKLYKKDKDALQEWRKEAEEDYNFVAGHQWDDNDLSYLTENDRPVITFNRTNTIIAAILGMEANQRQETTYLPREKNDTFITDALKEITKWIRDYAEIDTEEAMAFEDMMTCGMGWTDTLIDYEVDLDGKLITERTDPFEMFPDSRAKKRNLTDRRHQTQAKKMSITEIKDKWPESDVTITKDYFEAEEKDVSFVNPADRYESEGSAPSKSEGMTVLRHQWYEAVDIYRAADPNTGQIIELSVEEFNKNKEILDAGGASYIKQKKRKYFEAFLAGDEVLEKKDLASQSNFTFNCITGKRDHIKRMWYGIVRLAKDPQRWSNKFFSQIIDIIDSNAKGGVMVETGAVTDTRSFEEDWSRPDSVTWLKDGAIAQGKVMPRPVAGYPQGIDRLVQFAISSIPECTGVNMEVLGLTDRQQPGIVEETRKRSGYTILATFFDSLRAYRKQTGMLMLEYIKEYLPEQRMMEVLEEELHPAIQMIKQSDLKGINIVVAESPQSENNKLITWAMISNLMPQLLQLGVPVPPDILEFSPLPATLVEKWKQHIEQSKQQDPKVQQMIDMMQQLEAAQKQADVQKTNAEVENTIADTELKEAKAAKESTEAREKHVDATGKELAASAGVFNIGGK